MVEKGTSPRKKKSYALGFVILGAVFVLVLFLSVSLGRYAVSLRDITELLFRREAFLAQGGREAQNAASTLFNIRLPRIAAAALIGAALSAAGVSYQGMFRNPMVSPDILGASTGAGFGAALAILLGAGYFMVSVSAFIFGLAAVFIAYFVSRMTRRKNQTLAMILAGMVVSSLFQAATSLVKLAADAEDKLPAIIYWLMGSLSSVKPVDLRFLVIPMAVGLVPLFLLRWRMNLLTVGEEEAHTMGVNTTALRLIVVLCSTLLTAASVAVSGMIGWVGLVIPHFCRMIFGYDYRRLIPASMLFGAAYLVTVDTIARVVTAQELPLGILTAFVGAPLFLYLLMKGDARNA